MTRQAPVGAAVIGRARLAALGVLAAAPAFIGYGDFILNHFYRYGAVLLDSGLLADLAWHHGPGLGGSPLLNGESFYAYHIAPVLALLSALSWLVPVAMAQWFAIVTGIAHAALAIAVFWLLMGEYALDRGWHLVLALVLAIAFSFNGLAIAQVRFPHFEILIAGSLMLFLVAWWQRRWVLAALFFVFCLSCREDAGFHIFAVLAVLVAMRWRHGTPLSAQRPALIFLGLGFGYSLGALLLGMALFPGQSSFARVYLGSPPFAHLSATLVATRALGLVIKRSYIFLPAACTVVWAVIARNPYLLVGYIAFIPWTILHLFAASDLAGTLSSYYGFPYLIAAFWPLIGWLMAPQPASASLLEPLGGFAIMILASLTSLSAQQDPSHVPLPAGFTRLPDFAQEARIEHAIAAIHHDHEALGRVLAGDGVAALRPREFRRDETLWHGPTGSRDTLLYFAGGRDARVMARFAATTDGARRYRVAGTPLRLVTDRPLAALPDLRPLLRPTGN